MEFQMKSAHFVLPAVQSAIDSMVATSQHTIDGAKRDMRVAKSVKTQKILATFGAMAAHVGGKLSAYIGQRYVAGYWQGLEYVPSICVPRVDATIRIRDLDSFKDDNLVSLLEALDNMGLEVETKDYAGNESPNREFRYATDDYHLTVDAWVKSDSPYCKRVKTGETVRTVVDETWGIECNE
jgi:hypothetical protein